MIKTTYDLVPEELFRLMSAYIAIRNPTIRAEFLELVEAWSHDQWAAPNSERGN